MATQSESSPHSITPASPQPYSSLQHTYTRRQIKEYVLTDPELNTISFLNTMASVFFAIASAAASFVGGLYSSATIQGELCERATVLVQFGMPVGIAMAVGFAIAGFVALRKKNSEVADIKEQAVPIDQISAAMTLPSVSSRPTPDTEGSETE